jgi:release factor glutamine methyltransferase
VTDAVGPDDATYRPRFAEHEVERIRRWHEESYRSAIAEADPGRRVHYLGIEVTVPSDVMPVTSASHVLGEAVRAEVRAGETVVDMGSGSGVNAILAARQGARVVAVDVNPHAVDATRSNAERNGVGASIDVRRGDLFEGVAGELFDLIVFDPPYRWFRPRDALEAAMTDEDYRALRGFFARVRQHLAPGGRVLVGFATSGDVGYLRSLSDAAGFATEIVRRLEAERDGIGVEYFAFRLT